MLVYASVREMIMNVSVNFTLTDSISLVMDLPVHIKQFVLCSIMNINYASEHVQNPA